MSLVKLVDNKIRPIFTSDPYAFFTEHDIHTELSHIIDKHLQGKGGLYAITKDGKKVRLVHHEYPTPFRCDMSNKDFVRVTEEEFIERRRRSSNGKKRKRVNVRRGHFDLTVFNRDYVENNDFITITGKDYDMLLESFKVKQPPVLDLALEVMYFLNIYDRVRNGMMDNKMREVNQDYKKLVEAIKFKVGGGPFCKEAGMLFFSNTPYRKELEEKMKNIATVDEVRLLTYFS